MGYDALIKKYFPDKYNEFIKTQGKYKKRTIKYKNDDVKENEVLEDDLIIEEIVEDEDEIIFDRWWGCNIKLELSVRAYSKMVHYTKAAKGEISGFGLITKTGNRIIVNDVKIFKQICSGAFTSLDADSLTKFLVSLIRKGQDPNKWKLWWHSHSDFKVFFSMTDEGSIQQLSKNSYLLSICINKKLEMVARIDSKGQTSFIPVTVQPLREGTERICKNQVKKYIKYNGSAKSDIQLNSGKIITF